jgi:hypothetical protein
VSKDRGRTTCLWSVHIEATCEGKVGPAPFADFVKGYTDDELAERAMRGKSGADQEGERDDGQEGEPEPRP